MKTIKEEASSAAWQIKEEIGLSEHSIERVTEIIEGKLIEQRAIDDKECETMVGVAVKEANQVFIEKACEWLMRQYIEDESDTMAASAFINDFRKAMEE